MKNLAIDCGSAAELLPWYLNGTLGQEESAALEAHMESCPGCRQEHRDTSFAAAAFNTHATADQLVRYAFHQVSMGPERTLLEDHLRICSRCAEELKLVEASRDRQHEDMDVSFETPAAEIPAALPFRRSPFRRSPFRRSPFRRSQSRSAQGWQLGAIAASLLAILAAGYWLWNLGSTAGTVGDTGPATAGLEGPGISLPAGSESGLRVIAASSGTFDEGASVLRLEARTSEVELTFAFDGPPPEGPAEIDVLDSVGRRLWRGSALTPLGDSRFQARLPIEAFPVGELTLRVRRRDGGRLVTFAETSILVEAAP